MLVGNNGIADSDPIWITNAVDGLLSINCGYPVGDIKAARQVASRSNNMPLETLPDYLSEATHQELDKAVEKTIEDNLGDVSELSSNLQYGALLNAIIEHSNGHLDTKYLILHQATKLFNTHGELRDILRAAWKHKSYREIRNIGVSMTRCNLNHIYYINESRLLDHSASNSQNSGTTSTYTPNSNRRQSGLVLPITPVIQWHNHGITSFARSTSKIVWVV
jgi:hypothetical protein